MTFDPRLPPSLSHRLGRYRVTGKLGQGGMGEVFRADDERLGRSVAIKVIRHDTVADEAARARFRREARAAAALDHPAIVKVHEIVATDGGDAIVMELVDGMTLAAALRRGPLAPRFAIELGIEIAAGLAAAHDLGIVHRDLKAENVVVTPAGRAKILDFGIAKHAGAAPDESQAGVVVGTYRAMSPEQARGLAVDARSDLFALGVLLYETLTGSSPFVGPTVLATLTNVCTRRHVPPRDLRPELPEPLAHLLDHLLEKEPSHRPRSAREVAGALASILDPAAAPEPHPEEETVASAPPSAAATAVLPWRAGTPPPAGPASPPAPMRRRRRVAAARVVAVARIVAAAALAGLAIWVTPAGVFSDRLLAVAVVAPRTAASVASTAAAGADGGGGAAGAGAVDPDVLRTTTRAAVLRGLLALRGISVISPEQIDPVAGTPVEVARATAADEVVAAELACAANRCAITLSRLRGRDGGRLGRLALEAPADGPFQVGHAVESHVHLLYPERQVRDELPHLEVGAADYREYLAIEHSFTHREGIPTSELLDRLAGIRRRSPRFLEAALLEAELYRYRYHDGRSAADLEHAFATLLEARRLAPADPLPLTADFALALRSARLDRAAADLATLTRLQPGDPSVLAKRAQLLERRGARAEALAEMRECCRRRPSWANLMALAGMEHRFGESAAARADLERLLRRAPGLYQPKSLLAQIELLSGSPARAAELYAELVRRSPQETEVINLGTAYMLLRRYPEAEARFLQASAMEPGNPFVILNLADLRWLEGDRAGAAALYRRLLAMTRADPAAEQWELLSARAQAMAHLGQRLPAVAAAQRVLALAPGNAQAKEEVALVYALVGDGASALWNAEQALRQGVDPRWFGFPWFDALRSSPELRPLLAARPPA